MSKDKSKDGKKAGKKGKKGGDDALPTASVHNHPRAGRHVKLGKGWCGLLGFGITAYLSHKANVPVPEVFVRALIGGVAGYLVGWCLVVTVWRSIVLTEMRIHREKIEAELEERARERATRIANEAMEEAQRAKQRQAGSAAAAKRKAA